MLDRCHEDAANARLPNGRMQDQITAASADTSIFQVLPDDIDHCALGAEWPMDQLYPVSPCIRAALMRE
jgi:hypothetical protein